MPTEARLEELIEAEPTILGEPLLIIGRQVATSFGKIIDLLAVDADGILHVLELKKDKTPREVIAQVLDYGSWVRNLAHEEVLKLFADYGKGGAFEAAFQQRFDTPPPEELNTGHRLTIIASAADVATERIVEYLVGAYAVPVNVVFSGTSKTTVAATLRGHGSSTKTAPLNRPAAAHPSLKSLGTDATGTSRSASSRTAAAGKTQSSTDSFPPEGANGIPAQFGNCRPGLGSSATSRRLVTWASASSPATRRPSRRPPSTSTGSSTAWPTSPWMAIMFMKAAKSGSCRSDGSSTGPARKHSGRPACSPTRTALPSCATGSLSPSSLRSSDWTTTMSHRTRPQLINELGDLPRASDLLGAN
jgi:hypothetical protein